ncbi:hypothetical protein LY632_12605 [Erythrobacter sp. SDW2]|uniref:hypothetical protein n=1 Tax=Erythrobacter sp. SDW2 TaxID=2907154 RepID=UPI001F296FC7|nr:hypothetical protein [Erythrobacter sp. SDW2]UIP06515.1 hypothetical protein LY632_12605 [Erythrobacter sp. SDW2]
MRILTLSIAAIALAATGAYANPGNGKGQGNGKDRGGPPAKVEGNKGGGKPDVRPMRMEDDRGKPQTSPKMKGPERADRSTDARIGLGPNGKANEGKRRDDRGRGDRDRDDRGRDDVRVTYVDRGDNFSIFRDFDRRSSSYDGCPPGLAKKYNGCLPPGLAKKRAFYRPAYFGYGGFGDARFYYDDGFLIRLGGDGRISASIPLLGGALAIGNPWPSYYEPVELRPYYREYYGLQPAGYRYANNVIYRVDPETAAITSVAALLTGDDFVIGQPVPEGYPVYNVPYRYRDRYVDGPDGYYRYSDGYVYRIDPETRLVAAAIELLVD